uniref:Enolase 4 n=1 Tax=Neogobius melanostomus TaxID=47308 RepID=A0A8C6TQE2_9GOBI
MELRKGRGEELEDREELRHAAVEFYRVNRVPEQLERALNELFLRRPSDLYGHLADFFSALSAPPRISRVQGREVLDSRGQPSIEAKVYGTVRNREQVLESSHDTFTLNPSVTVQYGSSFNHDCVSIVGSGKKGSAVKGPAVKPLPPPEPPEPVLPGSIAVGALSLSVARAGAASRGVPLYQHVSLLRGRQPVGQMHVPSVLVSLLSYGKSSPGKLSLFEEVLLVPKPGLTTRQVRPLYTIEQQRYCAEPSNSQADGRGPDDSGAPCLSADRPEQPLDLLSEACVNLSLSLGSDLFLGLSCAGPNLLDYSKGKYEVSSGLLKSPDEMVDLLQSLVLKNPAVVVLIDPLRREDVEQWERLSAALAGSCSLLSDVTFRAQAPPPPGVQGHVIKHSNHVTVSELVRITLPKPSPVDDLTFSTMFVSVLRSKAVGLGHDFLRLGGLGGAERASGYNRLVSIEEELQRDGRLGECRHGNHIQTEVFMSVSFPRNAAALLSVCLFIYLATHV